MLDEQSRACAGNTDIIGIDTDIDSDPCRCRCSTGIAYVSDPTCENEFRFGLRRPALDLEYVDSDGRWRCCTTEFAFEDVVRSDGEWSMSECIVLCVKLIPPTGERRCDIMCVYT